MPKIVVIENMLSIELSFWESFLTQTKSFKLEAWRMQSVAIDSGERRSKLGRQISGRRDYAGVFMVRHDRKFVFWPKGTEAVVIQVMHPTWREIIVGNSNPEAIQEMLRPHLPK